MGNRTRTTTGVAAALLAAASLITLTACAGSPGGEPGVPPTTSPTVEADNPTIGGDLVAVVDRDFIPSEAIHPDAATTFGDEVARDAGVFAVSFGQATAEDTDLWFRMIDGNIPERELKASDYSAWLDRFTPAAGQKFATQLADPQGAQNGVGDFLILPEIGKDYAWKMPGLRPSNIETDDGDVIPADGAVIDTITTGPPSELNDTQQTVVVDFTDIHTYDYKYKGDWDAVEVERHWTLTLAPTEDPGNPFLIQDWAVSPMLQNEVEAVTR